MAPEHRSSFDELSWRGPLLLALLPVVVLPQLIGGVHPEVAVGAAATEIAALTWFAAAGSRAGKRLLVPWVVAPLLLGLLATLVQVTPLPASVLGVLSPAALERTSWLTELLPSEVRARVLSRVSLDPPETAFAAVRLLGATAMFLLLADVARHRRARAFIYGALLVMGAAMFVVALGHLLLNVQGAWGHFTMKTTLFYAPMVNPNQLGRVFGALSLVLVARALAVRSRTEIVWLAGVGVLCGVGVFFTLSRGAMVAYALGSAVLAALLVVERAGARGDDASPAPRRAAFAIGALVASVGAAVGLALYVAGDDLFREVSSLGSETVVHSKAALYTPALSLLREYATTGVGNNAFGVAFTERASPELFGMNLTFTHVENVVIGTLIEHGIFVGGLLLLVGSVVSVQLVRRLRDRQSWTPLPALACLVAGDLFDFVLESTAGLFLAGTLLALGSSAAVRDEQVPRAPPRAVFGALVLALLALIWLGVPAVTLWRPRLDDAIASTRGDARAPLLDEALRAHPGDAHYAYLEAVAARELNDPATALRWANRALVVWPQHAGAHIEAARALAASGRVDQAMLEYRAAWVARGDRRLLLDEVARRTDDVSVRRRALPETADAMAELALQLVREERRADAVALFDDAIVLIAAGAGDSAGLPYLRVAAAQHLVVLGDPAGAVVRLAPLLFAPGASGEALRTYLTAREALDGTERALAESQELVGRFGPVAELLGWQLDAFARVGRLDEALKLLEQVRRRALSGADLDVFDRREAALHARNGDRGRQLRLLERVAQRHRGDVALTLEVAALQLELGLVQQARASWTRAARIAPAAPEVVGLERLIRAQELAELKER